MAGGCSGVLGCLEPVDAAEEADTVVGVEKVKKTKNQNIVQYEYSCMSF